MLNVSLVLLSLVVCIQFGSVFPATQTYFNDDNVMLVEGNNCNSSEIKLMLIGRKVSKVHVYLTDTFYADEDLKLNGIEELQIFANTWHCTQPVTFDLSGTNGKSQDSPTVKGSPGRRGNNGKNGGNFLGLTNRTINGDYLTVMSNGGNGGQGQAGASSDDVYVLLNADSDTGDSGWFSSGDLHNYYKKYFSDRGYDAEISDIDDYTSFYAVFVHDKKASFTIRLHPQKCCGTTGVGGPGGHGGRRGEFIFMHLGKSYKTSESTPIFVANEGLLGKAGKDGLTCENVALDVRVDVELKKVVFIVLPLHHSTSSTFTVLNHVKSSKCSPSEYVRMNETRAVEAMDADRVDRVFSILIYKMVLLENMKNESSKSMAVKMYEAIDDNWAVSRHDTLRGLLLEAYELEQRYFELKKAINLVPFYQRLYHRVENCKPSVEDKEEETARWRLRSILEFKLNDLDRDDKLIVDLEACTEVAISIMDIRNHRLSQIPQFNDTELRNRLNQLQFEVNGKFIMAEYDHVIKGFQLTYFPFAVEYFETYNMSTSLLDYQNLDAIHSAAVHNINSLNGSIRQINSNNAEIMMNLNYIDYSGPTNAFFVWKHSDVRRDIRKLFAGEKITLLADVKKSNRKFNAMKFNKIDLYFRSSQRNITDDLNNVLKYFEVKLNHNGVSTYRCNHNFYQIVTDPLPLLFSFEKDTQDVPLGRLATYDMLLRNQPILSPYALWEIQLIPERKGQISRLAAFARFPIDIELHGTGKFIAEDVPICENKDLVKVYTQI